jgi:hypothetical protein
MVSIGDPEVVSLGDEDMERGCTLAAKGTGGINGQSQGRARVEHDFMET